MSPEELKKLTEDYVAADNEYHAYSSQFFTTSVNGVVEHVATKTLTLTEFERIKALAKRKDELEKKWLEALVYE